jgi:16S rRNA U1498 N3-methylase RsmE
MLAGRLVVPEVRGPLPLAAVWAGASRPLLFDRSGPAQRSLREADTLFIGPEGGWSPAELALAGPRRASLGPLNLRADTAALVALTLSLANS